MGTLIRMMIMTCLSLDTDGSMTCVASLFRPIFGLFQRCTLRQFELSPLEVVQS